MTPTVEEWYEDGSDWVHRSGVRLQCQTSEGGSTIVPEPASIAIVRAREMSKGMTADAFGMRMTCLLLEAAAWRKRLRRG